MAFHYRFEQLLRLATHEEDEVKARLALKDAQIAQVDANLSRIKNAFETALEEKTEDLLNGRMDKIRLYAQYFFGLERQKEFQLEEKERLLKQREKILAELSEKRRIRKTYEKLRERHEKNYRKNELRKDQKLMDDFGNRAGLFKGV